MTAAAPAERTQAELVADALQRLAIRHCPVCLQHGLAVRAEQLLLECAGRCPARFVRKAVYEASCRLTGDGVRPQREALQSFIGRVEEHARAELPIAPADDWPIPTPIDDGLPPVTAFPDRLLPEALRPWVIDSAERMQCAPEFIAVGAVVSLGAVIGRACGVKPRRHDDWIVVPNLWGAVVARSGSLKTPAFDAALAPIKRLEAAAQERHLQAIKDHEFGAQVLEARKAEAKKKLGKAAEEELPALRAQLEEQLDAPAARRYCVNDATVEKVGVILKDNTRGLLQYRDELTGWFASMSRDGHEGDRAFYLESWSGLSSYTFDRIGRGTVHLPAMCISVLGGIQPEPLGVQLRAALRGGQAADGLLQRFQLLVWPDLGTWRNVDRWPDTAARTRAFEVYERLAQLTPELEAGSYDRIPALRFDAAAQDAFDAWLGEHQNRIRAGAEHPAFESHLSKYTKLVPALALLGHLVDHGDGPIAAESVNRALAWADFLEQHARRCYASVTRADDLAAIALLQKIRRGEAKAPLIAREIYRRCWSGLSTLDDVEGALGRLEAHGYVRRVEVQTGGRPRVEFAVHPETLSEAA